ncbi:MAG TPA: diguanylate cyclase [Polyangiaceae bacterium]|jgi:diguanylate cyclase (GGDEF)-like protein|nr:diguanylate cyclase [Polyangiaceae bacterium]
MKAKVLVVEDSKTQREALVNELEHRGYEVDAAAGGLAALSRIKADPPDIVILDVVLDDMDGYSVCRWLRLGEATCDIVVIMLTVKIEVKERVEGLHVGADDYIPKPFDMDELEARMFAALRSRNARLELRHRNSELEGLLSRTERLAMTDALTGVYNRRRFGEMLRREWATARRYKHPLSLVLFDVDHFKAVNDGDGHAAGDEVLKNVAQIITTAIREVDVCARYGGDEFVLLLPHTAAENAVTVADRIREKLAKTRRTWSGAACNISLSAGAASSDDATLTNPDELMESADRALYEAKRDGRDRCVVAREGILKR